RGEDPRSEEPGAREPELFEPLTDALGFHAARLGLQLRATLVEPVGTAQESGRGDAERVVVLTAVFLPDVEGWRAPALTREGKVCRDEICGFCLGRHIHFRTLEPPEHGERAQGRTVVLRATPLRDVDRTVRIHARIGHDTFTEHGVAFSVIAHVLLEVPRHSRAPLGTRDELAPIELAQRLAETHEV